MIAGKSLIFIVCLAQIFDSSNSEHIECYYNKFSGIAGTLGTIYYCSLLNNPNFNTRHSAQIDSVNGTHEIGRNNENVLGFWTFGRNQFDYFPRGLENIFGNLKAITVISCGLKEIRQADLKPFTDLVNLVLTRNEIKVLEKGLFDSNAKLDYVNFFNNKIVHIDVDVFKNINKLDYLYLGSNTCINKYAENSAAVRELVIEAYEKCQDKEILAIDNSLKELENNICSETFENFNAKFEQIQSQVTNSKFSDFYQERIEKLTALNDQECPTVQEQK